MAIDKKIDEILVEFGMKLEQDLQDSLAKKVNRSRTNKKGKTINSKAFNPRLSGKIKSLPIKHMGDLTEYILQMPLYGKALDKGRGPTKEPGSGSLRKNLVDWIKRRNIDVMISKRKQEKLSRVKNKKIKKAAKQRNYEDAVKSLAYGIAKSIHENGYEGNQFFSEVINDGRLEKLERDLLEATQNEVIIEITKKF